MTIGKFRIEEYIDRLIKRAEYLSGKNKVVSKIIDVAFERIGNVTGRFYGLQDQALAMLRMLKAWYAREYTGLSKKAVLGVLASAIYIVNPFDFIPDFIPGIGRIDDRLVLGYLIKKLNTEIQQFMAWEAEQGI